MKHYFIMPPRRKILVKFPYWNEDWELFNYEGHKLYIDDEQERYVFKLNGIRIPAYIPTIKDMFKFLEICRNCFIPEELFIL